MSQKLHFATSRLTSREYQKRPELARNQNIYEKYLSGRYSYRSLARIFKISPQRIAEIIKRVAELKKIEVGIPPRGVDGQIG